jgi:hypothetical protein
MNFSIACPVTVSLLFYAAARVVYINPSSVELFIRKTFLFLFYILVGSNKCSFQEDENTLK